MSVAAAGRSPFFQRIAAVRLLLAGLVAVLALTACVARTPDDTARRFYETVLRLRISGLPSPDQLGELRPLITRELAAAFERARAEQERFRREHPEEKPPWIEGDLFSSMFEGAVSARVIKVETRGEAATALIALASAADGQPATEWIDRLRLRRVDGRWRVDDLEYGGDWDFAAKGSLRESLRVTP